MTIDETRATESWRPSPRWLFLVPVLLIAGTLSAILTVANPPEGYADIRTGLHIPKFVAAAPEYDPPEFDAYHIEERHEMPYESEEQE